MSKSLNEEIDKALCRAFSFGETYWQQADSESYVQNKKSSITLDRFRTFKEETLRTLRAGQSSEPVAWRPMETAPKDGRKLLLWWGDRVVYGYWLDNSKTTPPWAGWRGPSMEPMSLGQPTNWQPLPAAPGGGAGQSEPTNPVQVSTAADLRRDAAQDPSCVGAFARARPGCKP